MKNLIHQIRLKSIRGYNHNDYSNFILKINYIKRSRIGLNLRKYDTGNVIYWYSDFDGFFGFNYYYDKYNYFL